jgi:phage FluMu protein Com
VASVKNKIVKMICPKCKTVESTVLDSEEPAGTVLVEIPCPQCLDLDDSLPTEPVFRDKHGIRLC